jgi:predicted esterase
MVLRIAGYSRNDTVKDISVRIISGENKLVESNSFLVKFKPGFSEKKLTVESNELITGGYTIKVFCGNENIGEHYLTVFPKINTESLRIALKPLKSAITAGTFNTLMFYIADAEVSMKKLKSYECSFSLRNKLTEVVKYIDSLKSGNDLLEKKKGFYRRAYWSKAGKYFNPYSIYVPEDYNGGKKYPLLVYLHGSGDDDRVLNVTRVIPEGFIVLAPNGRGVSNCYTGKTPQEDIEEAISDVARNFNIDTTKIILSGFSMGGYGVYRTYYEHPDRYKAIAVISGSPDLARKWIGPDEPDFLEDKYLKDFKKIRIYIFHGTNDMNCPYELTERLVKKLLLMGCNVTFDVDTGGHGNMGPDVRNKYFEWLKRQVFE